MAKKFTIEVPDDCTDAVKILVDDVPIPGVQFVNFTSNPSTRYMPTCTVIIRESSWAAGAQEALKGFPWLDVLILKGTP